jgi:hypothetical protein
MRRSRYRLAGGAALVVAFALALVAIDRVQDREVSHVAIPGSAAVLVLSEDFKHHYSYRFFRDGRPVSAARFLGPRYQERCPPARVSRSGEIVRVDWGEAGPHHYVEIDLGARRVVRDSNGAETHLRPALPGDR